MKIKFSIVYFSEFVRYNHITLFLTGCFADRRRSAEPHFKNHCSNNENRLCGIVAILK